MTSLAAQTVRWGPDAAALAPGELAWPDLDPPGRTGDWQPLLERLAALPGDRPVLLLRAGVVLPAAAVRRLALSGAAIAAAAGGEAGHSPLPPGTLLPAPLPVAELDRALAWLGRGRTVALAEPALAAALWQAGAATRLLASGWQPGEPLPDGLDCRLVDNALALDPDRDLAGTPAWQHNVVPPPADALDSVRAGWPLTHERQARLPDVPAAPVAGVDPVPVVLHLSHGWGGGTARFITDLARADTSRAHLLLEAHGATTRAQYGEWLELRPAAAPDLLLERFDLAPPIAASVDGHALHAQALAAVRERWPVSALVVSSLIGHALAALECGLPCLVVCHDYYPLWPELHCDFGDPARRFDRAELERDLALAPPTLFGGRDAGRWWALREAFVARLLAARPTLVTPTAQVRDNWLRIEPRLAALQWQVVAHGLAPWSRPVAMPVPDRHDDRPLRVLVPGRISGGKGIALLAPLARSLPDGVELVLVGAGTTGAELLGLSRVHLLCDYPRDELPTLVASLAPDLALLPATVAETFGYLLSELRDLGVPVLATAIGAYRERIDDGVDGLLAEPEAGALARRLAALRDDRTVLDRVRARLAALPSRSAGAMAADYAALLPPAPPASRTGRLPDQLGLARLDQLNRRALEAEATREFLCNRLAEQAAELERRASWGFALDRQVRAQAAVIAQHEASSVNTRLRAEVDQLLADRAVLQARSDELERVHRSRSWRLMGPARRLARLLRTSADRLAYRLLRLRGLLRRARLSLSTRGLGGSLRHIRQRRRGPGAGSSSAWVVPVPVSAIPPARLPTSTQPEVSIVIPVHGKLPYTCACLASLVRHAGLTPFEAIVVDDASPDDSAAVLAQVEGLRLLRNASNLGFVGSCNAGAAAARGRWLLFLNNDTTVTEGWLEALLATFDEFPEAGLVGARLVYPDGRLQESGGLVFADGSGWNYGRFGDPSDPRYAWARATDYCSGAAIVIARALFERLGGFDQRYSPAYYEDTDLAFKVRDAGRDVVVQPAATVVHHEGVTAGTDTGSGIKRHQVVNQATFAERWRDALARQPAPGCDVDDLVRRAPRGRVLVVDATTPEPDQDSGSVRLVNLFRLLRRSGRHVTFLADNRARVPGYTERLQAIGIEVLYDPWLGDPIDWLRRHGPTLDAVIVCRHYIAASWLHLVRRYAPRARFVFDTVDLHYLREQRAAELSGSAELARQAAVTRGQELRLVRAADVTVVVSPAERALLAVDAPGARVEVLSNIHPVHGCRRPWAQRADLWFVGGFQHPPNVDAVSWFVAEVFPAIRQRLPGVRFHVVGSKMPASIRALAGDAVEIHGHVADLDPFLDGCRIAVAPLRYGAGVKGKVNMSMSCGQPVVATPMAVEGMHLADGSEVLVADDAARFADAVVRLYQDESLWDRLSAAGLDNVRRHFSFEAAQAALEQVLER
ncbi:MAG: glycosyltransferase [Xanthomonadales bacterium]|nr:glycosyltransferase [Xanthomonadales bacterium]